MNATSNARAQPGRLSKTAAAAAWWIASVALFVAIWEFCWYMRWANPMLMPPPHIFLQDILLVGKLFDKSTRLGNPSAGVIALTIAKTIGASTLRVVCGLAVALVVSLVVGMAIRYAPLFGRLILPVINLLAPVSPIAWLPVAMLVFGLGNAPAILFYVSIFISVDLEARKLGMQGDPSAWNPEIWRGIVAHLHLVIPLIYLVYLIFTGYSLGSVGIRATAAVALVSLLSATTRLGPRSWYQALETTARQAIVIAVPSAVAGSVVGLIVFTGLGLKLTTLLVEWSETSLVIALAFVAIACLIMGMGMPTAAAYLMVAVLMAPALIELGISTLTAHLFVFYFAILSMVTPPVAMAAYAAGGVAEANIWKSGLTAFRLSLVAFLVPFAFVANEALLFKGPWHEILLVTISAAVGTLALAGALTGYWRSWLNWFARAVLGGAAVLLITPQWQSDLLGLAIMAAVMGLQFAAMKGEEAKEEPP